MSGSKLKLITFFFVFVGATIFFWVIINGFLLKSRALSATIPFFFETQTLSVTADKPIPVNVFFRSTKDNKISAATIQLKYSKDNLDFDESMKDKIDVVCQNNDFSFTNLVNVTNDPAVGAVTITRGLLDNDDTKLPPHLDSGISCFGTVYFKAKAGLASFPQNASVSLNTDPTVCEVVGPGGKTYACDLLQDKNTLNITIDKPLPTPTPTPTCKTGVKEFSVEEQCSEVGFRYTTYVCFDGTGNREGTTTSCKTAETWRGYAEQFCSGRSSCVNPSTSPTPTCMPRPSCLDSEPRCLIPEPIGGWCSTSTAATLQFSPKSQAVSLGQTFAVNVDVDAGINRILSTDAQIQFDPNQLDVVDIRDGNYFEVAKKAYKNLDTSSSSPSSALQFIDKPGEIYIAGILSDPNLPPKTGRGTLATVVFRPRLAGSSTLNFVCVPGETANDSNIANQNAADIINCLLNGKAEINVGEQTTPPPSSCPRLKQGDCDCNGQIDIADFEPWRREYVRESKGLKCDFNRDIKVNLIDFNIWRTNYFLENRKPIPLPTIIIIDPTTIIYKQ